MASHSVIWFRNDLRVYDNPALVQACAESDKVTAVFCVCEEQWRSHGVGARRLQFIQEALKSLSVSLGHLNIGLHGINAENFSNSAHQLMEFCQAQGVDKILFNAEYALDEARRDELIYKLASAAGIDVQSLHGSALVPPGSVLTKTGQPYKVFTAFKREWLRVVQDYPLQPQAVPSKKSSSTLTAKASVPSFTGSKPLAELPMATEEAAHSALADFVESQLFDYAEQRDLPAVEGTSQLSPYLAQGLISARVCLHTARLHNQGEFDGGQAGCATWINELVWRDFYLHLLHAFPAISLRKALRAETERVPWCYDQALFQQWCEGRTGFPLVDAAMRQLNETGWMHNRLRMVTATFLTKYLLIDWRWGEDYFMRQLTDGHFAANNGGWQWCASTGTDAAPYFRILSPVRQGERFDPDAEFIKRFVPELAAVPAKIIHKPGHRDLLATGYPAPMVDLAEGKAACLAAFKFAASSA